MQRLGRQRTEVVAAAQRLFTPGEDLGARGFGQVERQKQPRARRACARLAQSGAFSLTSTRRRRCIATVVERSRTSTRSPGRTVSRTIRSPPVPFTHQQT